MVTSENIFAYINRQQSVSSAELAAHFGITRQAINLHIRRLINSGRIEKTGSTRSARYFSATRAPEPAIFSRPFNLRGLDESDVYERVAVVLNLKRTLKSNVETVMHYAFTEMLNNAIDHSDAVQCRVKVRVATGTLGFEIKDSGIGVFRSIADKFGLPDEQVAMIELLKGKTTTMPEAHSGEGIFFTSRAADRMVLRSHRLQIAWDRMRKDVFVSTPRFSKGTKVIFEIRRNSRLRLEDVFAEFAPQSYDYQFEKTRVAVKLLQHDYLSRSEAKRILFNLDKFSEVELDMRDVVHLGQGFADEVFRVFASLHPDVQIRTINESDAIAAMIRHVQGTV